MVCNNMSSDLHSLFTTSYSQHICFTPGQSRSQSVGNDQDSICIVADKQAAIAGMQVWSKHPPTGAHKLPTRSSSPQSADTSSQDPLEGLAADQVQLCLLLLHAILHRMPCPAPPVSGMMSAQLLKKSLSTVSKRLGSWPVCNSL